jgi:hypothetical protein
MKPDLARRAKEFASRTGQSFTEVVESAVSEHLTRKSQPPPRGKVRLPISKAKGKMLDHEQLVKAIEEADLEYDLKKIGKTSR